MPATPNATQPELVHRSVRLRLLPEGQAVVCQLAGTAGSCRFVWNHFLAQKQQEYADYKAGTREVAPNVSCYGLGQEFTVSSLVECSSKYPGAVV